MKTLEFRDGALWILDQTKLPHEPVLIECRDYRRVADAIKVLSVRGAPAIGLAAAYAMVLAARSLASEGVDGPAFRNQLAEAADIVRGTRPTAVNLSWAVTRMQAIAEAHTDEPPHAIAERLLDEADRLLAEDERANRAMGRYGAEVIADGSGILTHCNAGALATGAFGTALGVVRTAHEQGKVVHVWVDETRPLLQGSRLTAWELKQLEIPFTLIADNMAAHHMAKGRVDLVIVGADRIAANGDTANKIGTYGVALLAAAHGIPFYVAAPTSTVDLEIATGEDIPIEERDPDEVRRFGGVPTAPHDTRVANPAFDVTPARLIAAIVTERGLIRPPFASGLAHAVNEARDNESAAVLHEGAAEPR